MTEQEWLAGVDPTPMLKFLRGKTSNRKLRLFACACCYQIWDMIHEERSKMLVKLTEQFVDGKAKRADVIDAEVLGVPEWQADCAAKCVANKIAWVAARDTANSAISAIALAACNLATNDHQDAIWNARASAKGIQSSLLRCIHRNPFRPVAMDPAWFTWNDRTIRKIAQAIYDDRAFDRMPILADALEDAGCDNADILAHCRSGGLHVRGCWVVDILLNKK